ncbi:ATP-binding protein [Nitratiruptor sp. YY09-18]|uniref:ATP-binding protein n=1 Tax=Nitratiruptor sp. YY09-18 TaxID=2724901 RepID=UPI001915D95A|nr:ATP-binding protein [Nitratiruptor sp. YY09-18]BCD67359.1 hypothetical protein NitYY0918_C0244 [Nitratiruptor sp. YY09-18]
MEALEFFYDKSIAKYEFLPRKCAIEPAEKILITGPKYCGKYSLTQEFLHTYYRPKEVLLIDFDDARADITAIQKDIQTFISQNKIKIVVYYNPPLSIDIPAVESFVVVSHQKRELVDAKHYRLTNLDFEEYLLFEKRSDIKIAFNNFLKNGNYPAIPFIEEFKKDKVYQEMLMLTFKEDFAIFKEIAFYQGYNISAYFLFTRLKERFKISKDRFYALFEQWQRDRYIYLVPKFGAKRAASKLFFHDFTIKSRLFTQKEFPKSFENMVYLEIADQEICYLEPLGFYNPKQELLILAIPFGNETRIQQRIEQVLAKNSIPLKKIEVVTIATDFLYEIKDIPIEITPFYSWAIAKESSETLY